MSECLLTRRIINNISNGIGIELVVTAPEGSYITVVGSETLTNTIGSEGTCIFNIPSYGEWVITGTLGNESDSKTINMDIAMQYTVTLSYVHIYGISRNITSSSPEWTREDEAVGKTATASIGITTIGNSDFDDCYPWSEMVRETLPTGDVMVKIPKFWYKRYLDGDIEHIKIASSATEGFSLHPAFFHAEVESECLYIGAYAGTSSKSNNNVFYNGTRKSARSSCKSKGTGWYLWDISTLSAIQMLYLIEFATYNSQSAIGRGCADTYYSSYKSGTCDAVANLTGRPAGTDGEVDVVYRGIESLWGLCDTWIDGINCDCTNDSALKYYICNNPSKYADDTSTNYTLLSYYANSGYIKKLGLDESNSHIMLGNTVSGSATTYVCDSMNVFYYSGESVWTCSHNGGCESGDRAGMFYFYSNSSSSTSSTASSVRLMYIPS